MADMIILERENIYGCERERESKKKYLCVHMDKGKVSYNVENRVHTIKHLLLRLGRMEKGRWREVGHQGLRHPSTIPRDGRGKVVWRLVQLQRIEKRLDDPEQRVQQAWDRAQ